MGSYQNCNECGGIWSNHRGRNRNANFKLNRDMMGMQWERVGLSRNLFGRNCRVRNCVGTVWNWIRTGKNFSETVLNEICSYVSRLERCKNLIRSGWKRGGRACKDSVASYLRNFVPIVGRLHVFPTRSKIILGRARTVWERVWCKPAFTV